MKSNHVQTAGEIFTLDLVVDRDTRLLDMIKTHHGGSFRGTYLAVMIPFGIVTSGQSGGVFIWLWKTEWAMHNTYNSK